MDDRTWWTWIMKGYSGIVRMMIMAAEHGHGIPQGAASDIKEHTEHVLKLLKDNKRES